MLEDIPERWREALRATLELAEISRLGAFVAAEENAGKAIYPPRQQRFRALALTAPEDVRVVILGQDPYHGSGQATGLAFSVPPGLALPPSLRNIYQELSTDCGVGAPTDGDLSAWARQGVLLLNTALSVEAGKAGSHSRRGWALLTDAIIETVAAGRRPTVFILWGRHAHGKKPLIERAGEGRHLILADPHPSPLSAYRGFFGSRPFSRANTFLAANERGSVDWTGV